MTEILPQCVEYVEVDGEFRPSALPQGVQRHVLIFQDESICYQNDTQASVWTEAGEAAPKKKCLGSGAMIAGFVCECHGFMHTGDRQSFVLFEYGKNREGYW